MTPITPAKDISNYPCSRRALMIIHTSLPSNNGQLLLQLIFLIKNKQKIKTSILMRKALTATREIFLKLLGNRLALFIFFQH